MGWLLTGAMAWGCSQPSTSSVGQEQPAPKHYRIAYNVLVNPEKDDYEVWSMELDGRDPHNITRHKDVAWTYHACEDRLFFISDRDTSYRHYFLYETDALGKQVRKVSDLRLEDSWMSCRNQCKEMVVAGRVGKEVRHQLFLMDLETGQYRQLTQDTAAMYRDPMFSPDGQQIVCAYMPHKRDTSAHEELWIMNADGSGMRQLTHYPQDDPLRHTYSYKAGPPHWNSQENFITYQSRQAGKYSLYAVTPDGKRQWKLTRNPQEEGWHDWSPDGKWLAVELFDSAHKQFHIGLMDWATQELKVLTDTSYQYQQAPVFVEVREE